MDIDISRVREFLREKQARRRSRLEERLKQAQEDAGRIIEQLQNAVGLSKSLQVPLIDAFSPSFNPQTQEGNRSYVNPSDGIHPSVEGHQFMAEKIAQTLRLP